MTDEPARTHCDGCRCQGAPRREVKVVFTPAGRDLEAKVAEAIRRLQTQGRIRA